MELSHFRKGDMIMEVNGRSLQDMMLLDAYQMFRTLQQGSVTMVVKRGIKFKVSGTEIACYFKVDIF